MTSLSAYVALPVRQRCRPVPVKSTLYENAMIAAIAKVNGLTVVTRNVADFGSFGVGLLNPFEFTHG